MFRHAVEQGADLVECDLGTGHVMIDLGSHPPKHPVQVYNKTNPCSSNYSEMNKIKSQMPKFSIISYLYVH